MATTNYTWLQFKNMSGGISCKEAEEVATALVAPAALTDSSVISDTDWINAMVTAGHQRLLFPSIIRKMTATQHRSLVVWELQQLSSNLPAGWSQTASIQAKIVDIIDCINAPTTGKKSALQTWASGLTIDWTDPREALLKGLAIRVTNLLVDGTQTQQDVYEFTSMMRSGFITILGVNKVTVDNAILNQLKSICSIT